MQSLDYGGFPEAAYLLTLGEVPYLVGVFPAGIRCDKPTEGELFGGGIPPATKTCTPHIKAVFAAK